MSKTNYPSHDRKYRQFKKEGRAGWNTADGYEKDMPFWQDIFAHDCIPKSGKLLELGCGAGNLTVWLAGLGYNVCGTDIAPTAIIWARERANKAGVQADFQVGSVLDLEDYKDNTFDIVLDGRCFHCIIGDDRALFLASAYRVLKPNKLFIISSMCGTIEYFKWQKKVDYDPVSRCTISKGIATRYIGLVDDIINEVKTQGFKILDWWVKPHSDEGDIDNLVVLAEK